MIEIHDLTYYYSRKKILLDGLNLTLHAGKTYGLLGKNGAGKSSLIKNIAGLLFPKSGTCKVNGMISSGRQTAFLENLFFIPEECELPGLTIPDFIRIYSPFYRGFNSEQFLASLKTFNVAAESHLHQLSFGQRKKTYIAFALAANTKVLIMDEPTNGLDIPSKNEFRNMVAAAANKDRIVIMSTHQVRDLDDLIDSVIIIDDGEILLQQDKDLLTQKLFFSKEEESIEGKTIYLQQTTRGTMRLSSNPCGRSSYLDLELLFNATLEQRQPISQLFQRP